MTTLFQALADPTRLRILGVLATGEVCVCHLHESLRVPQPKVSRHLAYLRRAGLVDTRREGLWVYYRLADAADPVIGAIRESVTAALAEVDAVRRDTSRVQKKVACSRPSPAAPPPSEIVKRLPRRRRGLPVRDYDEAPRIQPTTAPAATSHVGLIE